MFYKAAPVARPCIKMPQIKFNDELYLTYEFRVQNVFCILCANPFLFSLFPKLK